MIAPLGLKAKITITVSALVALLMSALAYITFAYFEQQLKTSISNNQFLLISTLANELNKKLLLAHQQLILGAQTVPMGALQDPDKAQEFLDNENHLRVFFDNHLFLFTPNGRVIAESPFLPGRRGLDLSFRPYIKTTLATRQPTISDPYISSQPHKHPVIMMTAPIFNKQGQVIAILTGSLDLMGENILGDISRMKIGENGYLYLTTADRTVVMHPDRERIFKPFVPGGNLLYDRAVEGFEGTDEAVNTYGARMLVSFKRLKVNNWILAANYPVSEAHAIISTMARSFFLAALVGILCIFIAVSYFVKRVTAPLVAFTKHVENLPGKEGADKLIRIETRDEIGTLSQAFNRMITELDRQKEALQKNEERLRQAQKMEAVGLLAGGIAHDFNNLLTPILGYSDLLLTKAPTGDQGHMPLKQIRDAAGHAKDLTHRLLAFSRKQIIDMKTFDVGDIITRFEDMLRHTIRENITINLRIAPKLGLVRVDAGQIEQVLINLAINAQDAMPEGGTLTIEAQDLDLDESYTARHPDVAPGPFVMIAVSDTGIGMDEKILEHIFDPFFTTKELGKGTGLGLSTVYGIVKQHGGSVAVYSEKDRGSTFKVFIPQVLDSDAEKQNLPPACTELARGLETVLVVDDSEMVKNLACDMLRSLGYVVLTADSPERCLELARAHQGRINLLLTDVVMPRINGKALFERLQSEHPETKALFMSGYTTNVIGHHGVLDEGINFIHKPFSLHALSHKIRQVLDS